MATFDKFQQDLLGLEEDFYKTEINLTDIQGVSLLLNVLQAVKKLTKMKNQELTDEQLDLMYDPKAVLEDKERQREERRRQKEEEKALTDEEKKALSDAEKDKKRKEREARAAKRKKRRQDRIDNYKKIFKNAGKELQKAAEQILEDIKQAAYALWKQLKQTVKDLINAIVQTASAIPGIVLLIVVPPWNIPQAISYTMVIVQLYMNIISQIKNILPYIRPFNLLPLVTDKKNLRVIATIMDAVVIALRAFFVPIKLLNQVIRDLLTKISNFFFKNKNNIFRKATRKLKKLGHLYKKWWVNPQDNTIYFPNRKLLRGPDYYPVEEGRDYACYAFDEEDIDEIQGLLDTFIVGNEGTEANKVVAFRRKDTKLAKDIGLMVGGPSSNLFGEDFDFGELDLSVIADQLDNVQMPQINLDQEPEDRFIYDIELPDGSIIKNITEDGIEFYKQNYILKYMNAVNQTIETALGSI